MQSVLITGGGSGIGQQLAINLAAQNLSVYIVGRDIAKLNQTKNYYPQQIKVINADVSKASHRQLIYRQLKGITLNYLIHNAGIVTPITDFEKVLLNQFRYNQKTNIEAPFFLSQKLLSNLKKGSRILHISSGLAHYPSLGMLTYCMSKAALYMLYQGLNLELSDKEIVVGSVMPGVVETPMQLTLRSQDIKSFASANRFKDLYTSGRLRSAAKVAKTLADFLQHSSNETFSKKDWRIEEIEKL